MAGSLSGVAIDTSRQSTRLQPFLFFSADCKCHSEALLTLSVRGLFEPNLHFSLPSYGLEALNC